MSIDSTSETAIFERIVLPHGPGQPIDAARSVLTLQFSHEDIERMRTLADRARQGALTPEEQQEIDRYERVGHYLAILQSKARCALRDSAEAGS